MITRRANVGIVKQYSMPKFFVDELIGKKEVITVEERLTKQTLLPTETAGVALTVRDVKDTEDRVQLIEDGRMFMKPTTAPTLPKEGDIYYDSAAKAIYYYDGTAWKAFGITKLSELAIDVNKNWGGYNITNLGAGAHDVNAKLDEIATKVSKAGDTMTGRLIIDITVYPALIAKGGAAGATIDIDAPAGATPYARFLIAGSTVCYIGYHPVKDLMVVGGKHFGPYADNTYTLGTSSYRWANVYAVTTTIGDLVLEGRDAKWKITEKPDGIYAENLKNGKKYKLKMEEVKE